MLNVLYCLRKSKINLVMTYAVNSEINTPQKSDTAKPLMEPEPRMNSAPAVISVVTCESRMATQARS